MRRVMGIAALLLAAGCDHAAPTASTIAAADFTGDWGGGDIPDDRGYRNRLPDAQTAAVSPAAARKGRTGNVDRDLVNVHPQRRPGRQRNGDRYCVERIRSRVANAR